MRIADPVSEPWKVVSQALLCQARNEPVPSDLQDAVEDAATLLACAALIQAGMSLETAIAQFDEREFRIHLTYERETDSLGLSIEWANGTTTVVASGS